MHRKEDQETCWIDDAGDRLEAMGYAPGQIFEFTERIHPRLMEGGAIGSLGKEGVPPPVGRRAWSGIDHVAVKDRATGEMHILSIRTPLAATTIHKVSKWL